MKKFKLLFTTMILGFSVSSFAASVIVTETANWRSVPITVDTSARTYTVTGTVPTEGDYYYTYPGYRCFAQKRDIVGIDAVIFKTSISGGTDIYCYPE